MTSNGHASGSTDGNAHNQQPQYVPTRQPEVADGNLDPLLERNRVFAATGACAGPSISPANLPDHSPGLVPGQFRRGGRPRTTEGDDATWMPGHGSC
jgi:hypothetical protein